MPEQMFAGSITDTYASDPPHVLGAFRKEPGGLGYEFVQLSASAATAGTNGMVVYSTLAAQFVVTDDISTTKPNLVRGVCIGALAKGSWGWIQTFGRHSAVDTDGGDDIASGDAIIGDPTTDGVCDSVAAGTAPTYKVIGFAYEADSDANNTVGVDLTLRSA